MVIQGKALGSGEEHAPKPQLLWGTGGISKSLNLGCEMTEELLAVLQPSSTIKNLPTPLNDLPPSFTEAD